MFWYISHNSGQRLKSHYGGDILNFAHQAAYEYQQSDFHFFDLQEVESKGRKRTLTSLKDMDNKIFDLVHQRGNL